MFPLFRLLLKYRTVSDHRVDCEPPSCCWTVRGGVLRDGTRDGESERTFWGVHNLDSFGRDALDDNWRFPRHHETKTKGEVIVWPAGKANIVCVCPVPCRLGVTNPGQAILIQPFSLAQQMLPTKDIETYDVCV